MNNATYFKLIAEIDFLMNTLEEQQKRLAKVPHPLEAMIDKATGYDDTDTIKAEIINTLKEIIKRKKKLGLDYSNAEKTIAQIEAV